MPGSMCFIIRQFSAIAMPIEASTARNSGGSIAPREGEHGALVEAELEKDEKGAALGAHERAGRRASTRW
jgi:hypothetical protein